MHPQDLCGLLAEPERLRAHAAVVLGAGTPDEVAEATGMAVEDTAKALQRLIGAGLVRRDGDRRLHAGAEAFKEAVRRHTPAPEAVRHSDRT